MKDWIYVSLGISYKNYDGHVHIRKLNHKTAKYSYLTLWDHDLFDIFSLIKKDYQEKL